MPIKLLSAHVRLTDDKAMSRLLQLVPHGSELLAAISAGFRGLAYKYDAESRGAYFIPVSDEIAACYTVAGITRQQADAIERALQPLGEWSTNAVTRTVENVVGARFDTVQ